MPTAEDTLFQRFGKEFPKGTVLFREGETGKEMFVLQACQTRGRPMEEGVEIDFNLRELPRLTGVGEPGIRTELARMERSGLVERTGDRLLVRDTARLQDYLQFLALRWKFGEP